MDLVVGIIPADAGSTRIQGLAQAAAVDHPRGCGEHGLTNFSNGEFQGSSPRMRGAPVSSSSVSLPLGIIPADAGSTQRSWLARPSSTDHPRGCGEHRMS